MDPVLDLSQATILVHRNKLRTKPPKFGRGSRQAHPLSLADHREAPAGNRPTILLDERQTTEAAHPADGFDIHTQVDSGTPASTSPATMPRPVVWCWLSLAPAAHEQRHCLADASVQPRHAPHYALRGHQLGYRDKTNAYDGWDLPQWDQYIRELAIFGTNAIELIPPRSDDRLDSVHFPLPPLEMMEGMSRIADDYGLDVWIWYPALDDDYARPGNGGICAGRMERDLSTAPAH